MDIEKGLFNFILADGDIRKVKVHGQEIVQRLYFAVRNEEWLTIEPVIENPESEISGSGFICRYSLVFQDDLVHFVADMKIEVTDNTLVVEATGKAYSNFMKNRIGLCVHLPASLKGTPCHVSHEDGTFSSTHLPRLVSPHQPIKNISEIKLDLGHFSTKIDLEGDVFEMEDQRNWTDASYKIYSTPLELPFPVEVKRGDEFHQRVSIDISTAAHSPVSDSIDDDSIAPGSTVYDSIAPRLAVLDSTVLDSTVPDSIAPDSIALDSIALGLDTFRSVVSDSSRSVVGDSPESRLLSPPLLGMIIPDNIPTEAMNHFYENGFPFSFLRVDFRLYREDWSESVREQFSFARQKRVPVYAMLYFGERYRDELETLRLFSTRDSLDEQVQFVTLLSSTGFVLEDEKIDCLISGITSIFPLARVGAGTDANFAQLNRHCPFSTGLSFLSYSIQPREHASDRLSIIENIKGQYDTVKTARSFDGDKDVHISALSLYRRFNANVRAIAPDNRVPDYLYAGSDFETAWFIGSLHELIAAGARAANLFFLPEPGSSLLALLEKITRHLPEGFYSTGSLLPEKYALLSWKSKGKKHSVLANLTTEPVIVTCNSTGYTLNAHEIRYLEQAITDQGDS